MKLYFGGVKIKIILNVVYFFYKKKLIKIVYELFMRIRK